MNFVFFSSQKLDAYSISKFWSNLRISVFNDWHLCRNWIRWTIYRNATFQTISSGMVDIALKGNVTWCLNVVIKQFLYLFFYNELFYYDLFRFLSSTVEHLHSKTGIRPAPGRANWICISLFVLSYNSSESYYAQKSFISEKCRTIYIFGVLQIIFHILYSFFHEMLWNDLQGKNKLKHERESRGFVYF